VHLDLISLTDSHTSAGLSPIGHANSIIRNFY
jgi:hypothetical protein